mmetsp:Transcript_6114/g.13573  ORF Transcript_6114/g.13573 Transcript_6114/m.13573 type:complete len:118 (-) Transcript_6114:129-482(-)
MVLTTLGRTAARAGIAGRVAAYGLPSATSSSVKIAPTVSSMAISRRFASDYDMNLGWPGSKIRNPDPHNYNDVYPSMGWQWWAWIGFAWFTFFYGNEYDASRPICVTIGLFGPNMPL